MSDDLRALIRRCLAGEQAAMVDLVDRYRGRVFGLCLRMVGQREDAEDMAQETFVRVLRNLHQWDPERDFEPWLLAIAGNRCRSLLATRKRKPTAPLLASPAVDESSDPMAAQSLAEEVHLALERVRPEYRQAFLLFHEEGLSYAGISQAMGCPLGTVKTWVHRARRALIAQLQRRGVLQESAYEVREV